MHLVPNTISVVAKVCQMVFWGNRLQIKAEVQVLADVERSLRAVSPLFAKTIGNLQSLALKQDLLLLLLEDEQTRLVVWLYPLDHDKRHVFRQDIMARSFGRE